jgi:hypothetical protein
MSDLMQALLAREKAQRSVDRAVKDGEVAEAARIVAALHAAYAPFDPEVQALELRGDYGHPVRFGARDEHLRRVRIAAGLALNLGSRINRESLRLTVTPRRGEQPASVRLHIERSHPYKPEQLAEFARDHSAEDMVRALLAELVPHVHDDSLAGLEGAVQ